ncbi:hypothetical protein [Flavobacterium sp.]
MKKLYTSMFLVLVTAASFSQKTAYVSNNTVVIEDQIVSVEDNQIVSVNEVEAHVKNEEFRYYYFPNLYAYYDLETNNYIYKINNKWQTSSELPQYYGGYSLFKNARIPVKDYIGETPQEKLNDHKKQFPYIKKSRMLKTLNLDGNTAISSIN